MKYYTEIAKTSKTDLLHFFLCCRKANNKRKKKATVFHIIAILF